MYPSVKQSISSICKALEEVVIPELKDSAFAHEQAAMITAQLKQVIDVVENQHQYLRVELEDTLNLMDYWQDNGDFAEQECPIYNRLKSKPADELQKMMFVDMQESLVELKAELNQLIEKNQLKDGGLNAELQRYIERQLERETAWFRLSGFVGNADQISSIADVLKVQSVKAL